VSAPGPGEPMGTFPFCSDRCKLIDLGRWLDGKYQIPVAGDDEDAPPADAPGFPAGPGPGPDSNGGTPRRSSPPSPN
jgi:uncharacterized protein